MYKLKKSKKIFLRHLHNVRKNRQPSDGFTDAMRSLQTSLINKSVADAEKYAKKIESMSTKRATRRRLHTLLGIAVALIAVIAIRSSWFELYTVPTGSMRPTIREGDRLAVSKCAFGINIPMLNKHFYFNRDLLPRNSTIIFTGENMMIPDDNITYFYIFNAKKRFLKRVIGKPGDVLYFYGGLVYGVDKHGYDISEQLNFGDLDHIPSIQLEGVSRVDSDGSVVIEQMKEPLVRLRPPYWRPEVSPKYSGKVDDYHEIWGLGNYALSRILSAVEVTVKTNHQLNEIHEDDMYMEILHHPSIRHRQGTSTHSYLPHASRSLIKLDQSHLENISRSIYTSRFTVSNGIATSIDKTSRRSIQMQDVPDGEYEFYNGEPSQIHTGGISRPLPQSHPLRNIDTRMIKLLYNFGISFNRGNSDLPYFSRYVYYRNGDLYALGVPIIKKDDPTLLEFNHMERYKESLLTSYAPFIDGGPPLMEDGSLDTEKILNLGLYVPENKYLGLGDNHSMSGDSREFGFIPENNITARPVLIFWPPGDRLGRIPQPIAGLIQAPRLIIWGCAIVIWGLYLSIQRYRLKKPI